MTIVFTGGGTAGHVNPALSVARFVRLRHPGAEIVFIGSRDGIEEKLVPREGYPLELLNITGIQRGPGWKNFKENLAVPGRLIKSNREARKIIARVKPDVVLGTGGYASYPAIRAAARAGVPCAIHAPDAQLGLANKALAKHVDAIMLGFEDSKWYFKDQTKLHFTGTPIRDGMIYTDPAAAKRKLGLGPDEKLVVSVFGSTGARDMNKRMADMFACEVKNGTPFRHIHAAGEFGYKWMPEYVRSKGVDLLSCPRIDMREYIYDMCEVMAAADLIITRAGMNTLCEICATGTPAIIVPSPNVAENHQEKNARALEARGAARVLLEQDCTGEVLYNMVVEMLADQTGLKRMSEAAADMAVYDGVERIYNVLAGLIKANR